MKHKEKLEDLIQGIEDLLSTDRCSLNEEDKVLLQSCIAVMREAQRMNNLQKLMLGLTMLAKFFSAATDFIDLLS